MPPNFKAVPLRSEKKSAQKMFLRKRFAKVQLTLVAILGFLGVGQAVAQDGFRVPAVSTNLIDWALVTPNVGVDIPLTNPIYINGASLYVEAKMSLNANKAYAPDMNYEYFSGKIEYRRHFRFGENSNECSLMTNAWNGLARLFTTKKYWIERVNDRLNDKGRSYAGIFAQYADFSMCLPLYNYEHGRVGRAAIAGFSYGFNKPFYNFSNKSCNNTVCATGAKRKRHIGKHLCFFKNNTHSETPPLIFSISAIISSAVGTIPPVLPKK